MPYKNEQVRKLGLKFAEELIEAAVKEAMPGIVNPAIYDGQQKKYQSKLVSGAAPETAKAPQPKVVSPIL